MMKHWKVLLLVVLVSLNAVQCRSRDERISALLRPMLNGGPIPAEKALYDALDDDYVRGLSPD